MYVWPNVPAKEWKPLYRAEFGVELKTSDLAYKKIAKALDNAK